MSIGAIAADYRGDNVFLGGGGNSVIAYDTTGRALVRKDSISTLISYYEGRLISLNDRVDYFDSIPVGKVTLIDIFSPDLHHEGGIDVPYNGHTSFLHVSENRVGYDFRSPHIMSNNGKDLLIKDGRNDTVFHYKNDMPLEPAYKFDFGKHSPPPEVFGLNPAEPLKDNYCAVNKLYEGDRYIIADINRHEAADKKRTLLLDRDDPSGGFSATGPGGKPGFSIDGIAFTLCSIHDNRLVGYIDALDLTDNRDNITNPKLKAVAGGISDNSDRNPQKLDGLFYAAIILRISQNVNDHKRTANM